MSTSAVRRLPGFRFETQPPPLADVLPRMDVAAFVGFAASGPINIPVAVEDTAHFAAIFGDDAPLAWDRDRGETLYAYLAPTVRAFFRNGGARCWVIRVAGDARYNQYAVPGLVQISADGQISPAYVRARSEGSWSDELEVSASLNGASAAVIGCSLQPIQFVVSARSASSVGPGDLVRLSFPDGSYIAFFEVKSVEPAGSGTGPSSPPSTASTSQSAIDPTASLLTVTGGVQGEAFWFATNPPSDASIGRIDGNASIFTSSGEKKSGSVSTLALIADQTYQATFVSTSNMPVPGSWLKIADGGEELWLAVERVSIQTLGTVTEGGTVLVEGPGIWRLKSAPKPLPSAIPQFEVVTFDLWVRQQGSYPVHLDDLGFVPAHSRYWAALPGDADIYRTQDPSFENAYQDLWTDAASPRFPLAGDEGQPGVCLPIAMALVPQQFAPAEISALTTLERDGLAVFDASLFIDSDMAAVGLRTLMAQADFVRYQSPTPRPLTGMHAVMSIEEATIVSIPDAVHRGWTMPAPRADVPDTVTPQQSALNRPSERSGFLPCQTSVVPAPVLVRNQPIQGSGTFDLTWTAQTGAAYTLEQAAGPDFTGAEVSYQGTANRLSFYGTPPGDYFYRAQSVIGNATSDWSNVIAVTVAPSLGWTVNSEDSYSAGDLIAVQRAMLRMCAARGDLFAILNAPEHYREDKLLEHVAIIKPVPESALQINAGGSWTTAAGGGAPIGAGEAIAFSYGGIYHPWPVGQEENQPGVFRRTPPDGAMSGVMAKRSLGRGAWIAPANELVRGVVQLTPAIRPERWIDLQQTQVNLIRQEPRGFVCMSTDTLTDDSDLRPINVRRLLILLRRLALRLGATYVFEPNDDSFRRMVQRGFEAMLKQMYSRGAFAGTTPETSFQVVAGAEVNSAQSVDQGRFIVELKVAPSLPMTFLTVRLVQSGDQSLVVEVR